MVAERAQAYSAPKDDRSTNDQSPDDQSEDDQSEDDQSEDDQSEDDQVSDDQAADAQAAVVSPAEARAARRRIAAGLSLLEPESVASPLAQALPPARGPGRCAVTGTNRNSRIEAAGRLAEQHTGRPVRSLPLACYLPSGCKPRLRRRSRTCSSARSARNASTAAQFARQPGTTKS